jgi:hypothetical protein
LLEDTRSIQQNLLLLQPLLKHKKLSEELERISLEMSLIKWNLEFQVQKSIMLLVEQVVSNLEDFMEGIQRWMMFLLSHPDSLLHFKKMKE